MKNECLRRYTYLPYLIDVLQQKSLTFLDPSTWDDKNDSYFMRLHKKRLGLKSLLALCFTDCHEKYAIWKVFAGDASGVSIEFDKPTLLRCLRKDPHITWGEVEKQTKRAISSKDEQYSYRLPFVKRWGFRDMWEFRAIYEDKEQELTSQYVPIDLDSIVRITFNPWIPYPVFESNRLAITKIDGCEDLKVDWSDFINSKKWRSEGDRIANLLGDEQGSKQAASPSTD